MSVNQTISNSSVANASTQPVLNEGSHIGTVAEVDSNGKIKSVLSQGILVPIFDQSTSVPRTTAHETCIFEQFQQHAIVTHLLLGEAPPFGIAQQDGKLVLDAGVYHDAVEIKAGHAQLELCADGRVKLKGKQIATLSEGDLTLDGERIHLNCD